MLVATRPTMTTESMKPTTKPLQFFECANNEEYEGEKLRCVSASKLQKYAHKLILWQFMAQTRQQGMHSQILLTMQFGVFPMTDSG